MLTRSAVWAISVDECVRCAAGRLVAAPTLQYCPLTSRTACTAACTACRSNAYTDFHHTVFHVHSPDRNASTAQPMLWQVLDALTEVAFEAEFLPSRIEKERKAVVAEAQVG